MRPAGLKNQSQDKGRVSMAIYHIDISTGSKAREQSALAKANYILREGKYKPGLEKREGKAGSREAPAFFDFGNMPSWALKPQDYWRAADNHERANGRLYVQVEVALPVEFNFDQKKQLSYAFTQALAGKEKLPYTYALHDDIKNPHLHLIISERQDDGYHRTSESWFRRANTKNPSKGGAKKTETLRDTNFLPATRELWANLMNAALERAGIEASVSHRSLEAQRINREAQIHEGRNYARKQENQEIKARNAERAELEILIPHLDAQLAAKLTAKKAEEKRKKKQEAERAAVEAAQNAEADRLAAEARRAAEQKRLQEETFNVKLIVKHEINIDKITPHETSKITTPNEALPGAIIKSSNVNHDTHTDVKHDKKEPTEPKVYLWDDPETGKYEALTQEQIDKRKAELAAKAAKRAEASEGKTVPGRQPKIPAPIRARELEPEPETDVEINIDI